MKGDTDMSRRGENIYKRKDGRYEGRYVIGKTATGRTRFGYVYARQYTEVRTLLLQRKASALKQLVLHLLIVERWRIGWKTNCLVPSRNPRGRRIGIC